VGARFSVLVQTGPGAHSGFYIIAINFLSREVERLGLGFNHPPPFNAEVKERVEPYLYSPSGPSWPVVG
jgi:hypothetical protein